MKWSSKTASCVERLRHGWQMCQSSARGFDLPELCHTWLSTLQGKYFVLANPSFRQSADVAISDQGFLELNKEAMPSLSMSQLYFSGFAPPAMQQWGRPALPSRDAGWSAEGSRTGSGFGSAPSSVYSSNTVPGLHTMFMAPPSGVPHVAFTESHRIMHQSAPGASEWASSNFSSAAAAVHNGMHPGMPPRQGSMSHEFATSGFNRSACAVPPSAVSSVYSNPGVDARWAGVPTPTPLSATELNKAPKQGGHYAQVSSAVHACPQLVSVRLASFTHETGAPSPSHLHRFPKASSVAIPQAPRSDFGARAVVYLGQNAQGAPVVHL